MFTRYPIDWDQAQRQRRVLDGTTLATIQTFTNSNTDRAEDQARAAAAGRPYKDHRARVLHGDLADPHFQKSLQRMHDEGAGLFGTVNRTDLQGRRAGNIVAAIAAIIDADLTKPGVDATCSAFLEKSRLVPSMIVESSAGNYHYYFRLTDCTLTDYEAVQRVLYTRAGTDPLHDLSRVLRIVGAYHCKVVPFQTRIVDIQNRAYTVAELCRLAKRVAPVMHEPAAARRSPFNTTVVNQPGRVGVYEATQRLHVLYEKHSGLVRPAIRELVQQIGNEGCGRHNAIVAIAGRCVLQRWTYQQSLAFLVPLINDNFGEGDWTGEVEAALKHAHGREAARFAGMKTASWPSTRVGAVR